MAQQTIAELIADTLEAAGVKRVYGVTGDSLNGLSDALRRKGTIEWIHMRHEEAAAFAAGAEAQLTGKLAVCAGSCGPGNLHLVNGLFDCHRSGARVLAIAAQIPSAEIGSGYFQETHPDRMFSECSHYVELVSTKLVMPRVLDIAIRQAISKRGVSVVVIPGDVAMEKVDAVAPARWLVPADPVIVPSEEDLDSAASLLDAASRVTIFAGTGCAGAHDNLIELADILKAPVVHALRGKEHVEWDNPYDVGMTGLIGFASGYHAMKQCDTLLMLGTDFPYRQFYPNGAKVIQVDIDGSRLGRRTTLDLGLTGDVNATLSALIPRLQRKQDGTHLQYSRDNYASARKELDELAGPGKQGEAIHPQYVARLISEIASDDAVFTCDVGTPTVWAARYLKMNGRRRLLGSFVHGSMANAMVQAIGAQAAFPDRQIVSLSGDGGFAMLMGDMLTLRQSNLPVKIVIINNGVLGFVDMEMKAAGFLPANVDLANPNFAAMAEACGIMGIRVEGAADLDNALRTAFSHKGPAVIDVVTNHDELAMPPKITLEQVGGFSLWMAKAVLSGRGDTVLDLARSNIRW